jgi:hypothetical protein
MRRSGEEMEIQRKRTLGVSFKRRRGETNSEEEVEEDIDDEEESETVLWC